MDYKQQDVVKAVRESWRQILPAFCLPAEKSANGEKSFICPFPDCGHGANGDGLTYNPKSADGNGLHCFSCGFSGDIIDLYRKLNNCSFVEAVKDCGSIAGINTDCFDDQKNTLFNGPISNEQDKGNINLPPEREKPVERLKTANNKQYDFSGYYKGLKNAADTETGLNYLLKRGISAETAKRYNILFDQTADPAASPDGGGEKKHPAPRLVIPCSDKFYLTRATDFNGKYAKLNPAGCAIEMFNTAALYSGAGEVFITEGIFNCLSLLENGIESLSLNSASNAQRLVDTLAKQPTTATLVLCLDNDDTGKRAQNTIETGLRNLNISYVISDFYSPYNDINDFLVAAPDNFNTALQLVLQETTAKPYNVKWYINNLMGGDIELNKKTFYTGFKTLDEKSGGIHSGLYCLAGLPSLGKTSFLLQICDQIAEQGNDILYFSLEMSRLELVTKSVARTLAASDTMSSVTARSIAQGQLPETVLSAVDTYMEKVSDRLSIIEGNMRCTCDFISKTTQDYITRNNTQPLVAIDYIQLLQIEEESRRAGGKELIDLVATDLKRMSRALSVPVVAISSTNRTSYTDPISYESLKESGMLEYSADCVWGLQFQRVSESSFQEKDKQTKRDLINKEKDKRPRKVSLVALKNRFGVPTYTVNFDYWPAIDLFRESDTQ